MLKNPFAKQLAAIAGVAALLFVALVFINPFGIWPDIGGSRLFGLKAERIDTVRMVKAYDLVDGGCPDDVITGMSTVVWGVDPAAYPRDGYTLYNGGIVGSSMEEQYYYIMRYVKLCPSIKRVYIDLNGEALRVRNPTVDFVPERLAAAAIYPPDIVFTAFSTSGILAAARTVSDAATGRVKAMLTDNGNGYHYRPNLGTAKDHFNAVMGFLTADKSRQVVRVSELQIGFLKQLIYELKQREIEPVVFFAPISQVLFAQAEAREVNPLRPGENMYFDLRRRVAELTDFWDCGLNNAVTGEDFADFKYFFDQIHYLPNLGTAVLAKINGVDDPAMPQDLCVPVTEAGIDAHIARLKAGTAQWRQQYPQYAKIIDDHYGSVPINPDPPPADQY